MRKTVCVQIGNSDDKLSQQAWSEFCEALRSLFFEPVHFCGWSPGGAPWQNMCIVAEVTDVDGLIVRLGKLAKEYGQDTIAVLEGRALLVAASQ